MSKSQQEAWDLVCEFVQDNGLRRHMLAVAAAMRWYAADLGEDPDRWAQIGLIHDFDWEIHPDLERHPLKGADILRERGWDEGLIGPILAHNTEGTGVEREQAVDFALLACDEITGLLIATALVRPSRDIRDMTVASVRKKWKDQRFAAGVDRAHVMAVTADFSRVCYGGQLDLWTHVGNVLAAMQAEAGVLELDGRLA